MDNSGAILREGRSALRWGGAGDLASSASRPALLEPGPAGGMGGG